MFKLTKYEISQIEFKKKCYPYPAAAAIEALKIVQKNHKWISSQAIISIAKILKISAVELESIATFYCHIFRKPVGRNIIQYCDSMVCFINGYRDIELKLKKILKIEPGQTTIDNRFTLLPTCCLGACHQGPALLINNDLHILISSSIISTLLEKYK